MNRTEFSDGWIEFHPSFLTEKESSTLFSHFHETLPWQQGKIKLFGKEHRIPRLESFHSEEGKKYSYSGKTLPDHPFDVHLLELKERVENLTGLHFNCVLVNLYRNGVDSNGWHADNETELGKNPVIASVSLGAARRFDLKHNTTGQKVRFELTNGSLLLMGGALQHHWKHCIPKQPKIHEGRINLTFRNIH